MPVSTGAYGSASNVTTARAATFTPQMWSDEIIAAYKRALVMAPNVRRISVRGQKGSAINVPSPIRGTAVAKATNTVVTLQYATESSVQILIDKHFEYSRLIEDIVEVQALDSLRTFYTDDAGYALARQVDLDLIQLGRLLNGGSGATYAQAFIGSDGTTAYTSGSPNAAALTDAAIRRTIQRMDDNDIPQDGRRIVTPPSQRNTLLGIDKFTFWSALGEASRGNSIRNGKIGDLYGNEVFVTPNADTATGAARATLFFHRDTFCLVEQQGVRSQTQYKQEYLADLMTADTIYGVKCMRPGTTDVPTGGFALMTP